MMPTISIDGGQELPVGDDFFSLSPDEQATQIDALLAGQQSAPEAQPAPTQLDVSPTGGAPVQTGQPEQQAQAAETGDEKLKGRAQFLPLGVTESGETIMAIPQAAMDAFQTLRDVLDGKPVDPGKIAVDLGMLAAGGAPAKLTTTALQAAGRGLAAPAAKAAVPGTGAAVKEAAARIGADLPPAATSDSVAVQQLGQAVSQAPVAGTPLVQASERAITQVGEAAQRVQQGFGRGSPLVAGEKLKAGLETHITERTAERITAKFDDAIAQMDEAVKAPLTETASVAGRISKSRADAKLKPSGAVREIQAALDAPEGLTFEGMQTLRTSIGQMIDNPQLLPAKMPVAELKRIYAALNKDLRNAAFKAGGEQGRKAFDEASNFTKRHQDINRRLTQLLKADSPEKLMARIVALASKSKATTSRADLKRLAQSRRVVDTQTWDELASATIAQMGRDAEGNFSPNRFLTAWGNLSDGGKRILFQSTGRKALAKALDDINEVSSRFKLLQKFANPSGTGRVTAATAFVGGIAGGSPLSTLGAAVGTRVVADILAAGPITRTVANWSRALELFAKNKVPAEAMSRATRILAAEIAQDQGAPELTDRIARDIDGQLGIEVSPASPGEAEQIRTGAVI